MAYCLPVTSRIFPSIHHFLVLLQFNNTQSLSSTGQSGADVLFRSDSADDVRVQTAYSEVRRRTVPCIVNGE